MGFDFVEIDRVSMLSPEEFRTRYLKPGRPVVFTDLAKTWPAYQKWTFDYLKQVAGAQQVGLYDDSKADYSKSVNEPVATMPFGDYLDLIQREPTKLRIFLWNIYKHVPQLVDDTANPTVMSGFLDRFPMMFFGGQGSSVFLHYDLDLSHVFHTHFQGRKRCILFPPEASERLYRLPFAVHNIEDIDVLRPDLERWPALDGLRAYQCELGHGETLFMPSGWWHHMTYLTGSFSISLRALDENPLRKLHSVYNVFLLRGMDNIGRKVWGPKWFAYKERQAYRRAERAAGVRHRQLVT